MRAKFVSSVSVVALAFGAQAAAQDALVNYNIFGSPGLLEMPTAQSAEAGTIFSSASYREGLFQTVLGFQVTDRISGSFRYALVDLYDETGLDVAGTEFERGFDLHVRLLDEGAYMPEVAIGLRDFLTPGRLQSEYLVATKSIGDALRFTAGLGWGAMATRDGFDNPISARSERPIFDENQPDGQLASDAWFSGDTAVFGGLSYQVNQRWGLLAEYSSISYPQSPNSPALDGESPYSLGVTYRPSDGLQFAMAALNGSELAVSASVNLNANDRPGLGGSETMPIPVRVRSLAERETAVDVTQGAAAVIAPAVGQALQSEGITLIGLDISATVARVRFSNGRYRANAQALGRIARILTQALPATVETFSLEQVSQGIPLSAVVIARSDLESLENRPGAAETLLSRAEFIDAPSAPVAPVKEFLPGFEWDVSPYFRIEPAGGAGSVSVDLGISLSGVYHISPQLSVAGVVQQSVLSADPADPVADTTPDLQNVRTDSGFYGDDGMPVLQSLAVTHYGRPAADLYSRISLGYLERMFGGVSTELLWKPVESRLGIGAEFNYVAQRNTDILLGFDEYDYQVASGHLTAYYDFGNGYHTQLDVGRYLAGDWGATLEVAREFENGVRIAAHVTQTDVSYEDFGDGSYNKGVSITVPHDFFTGRATRDTYGLRLSTRGGDGGARLAVDGRLYDIVRGSHAADLDDTWGRFWR